MIHLLYGRGIIQRSIDHVPRSEAEKEKTRKNSGRINRFTLSGSRRGRKGKKRNFSPVATGQIFTGGKEG